MLHARCPGESVDAEKKNGPACAGPSCSDRSASGGGRFLRLRRIDADLEARLARVLELHDTVDERVNRVVCTHADVAARVPLRTTLPVDNVASDYALAAEFLDTAVFRIAVAPVTRRADAFLMSHSRLA